MFPEPLKPIPLQALHDPLFIVKDISLSILRIDQIDPAISGNKWFKLKHNLLKAKQEGYQTLLSFGGPFSNHLHALATAGKAYGFKTIGFIRGEEHLPLNPTLSDVVDQGMKLYYINRKMYRNKHLPETLEQIRIIIAQDDPFYLVPEGGTNDLAVLGAAEISAFIPAETDYICVSCGTGGTMAGIITGLSHSGQHHSKVLGFPAMKGGQFLNHTLKKLLSRQKNIATNILWSLFYDFHFGGFGKINQSLAIFLQQFEKKHSIELDPIYTAKMMYAIVALIKADYFPRGSQILAVHTGGLQGKRGLSDKLQQLISDTPKS